MTGSGYQARLERILLDPITKNLLLCAIGLHVAHRLLANNVHESRIYCYIFRPVVLNWVRVAHGPIFDYS